jgi:hypothetical protein
MSYTSKPSKASRKRTSEPKKSNIAPKKGDVTSRYPVIKKPEDITVWYSDAWYDSDHGGGDGQYESIKGQDDFDEFDLVNHDFEKQTGTGAGCGDDLEAFIDLDEDEWNSDKSDYLDD